MALIGNKDCTILGSDRAEIIREHILPCPRVGGQSSLAVVMVVWLCNQSPSVLVVDEESPAGKSHCFSPQLRSLPCPGTACLVGELPH